MSIRILNPKSWHSTLYIMRERPGMYFGSKSLKGLWHFVDGIFWAAQMYNTKQMDDFKWYRFEPWVSRTIKSDPRGRSFYVATQITKTDEEAFDLWFEWYDKYNKTEGKEDYENWQKNNEGPELNTYIDDGHEDPSLY